jgi:hypothetical protein
LLLPVEGARVVLEALVRVQPLILRLFVNDITPAKYDTIANYVECNVPGYAPIVLAEGDWRFEAPASLLCEMQTFTFNAPTAVYGCYCTQRDSGRLVWAQRAEEAPLAFEVEGEQLYLAPMLSLAADEVNVGAWVMTPGGLGVVAALPGTVLNPVGVGIGAEEPVVAQDWLVHHVGEDGLNAQRPEEYEVESFDSNGQPQLVTLRRMVTDERPYPRSALSMAEREAIPVARRSVV